MKKPDEYEILERAHQAAGAHMMQKSPRADELIACLECEIAKRDEELAACRVAVENCELFRARIADLEHRCGKYGLELTNEVERRLQAERQLSALKAQGVVMPTVDQAMRVVLREMGNSTHVRGTSNWCADVGRAVLEEVARLNAGLLPVGAQTSKGITDMRRDLKTCDCGEPTDRFSGQCAMCETDEGLFEQLTTNMPEGQKQALLAMDDPVPVQQVSVPDERIIPTSAELIQWAWEEEPEETRFQEGYNAAKRWVKMQIEAGIAAPAAPAADAGLVLEQAMYTLISIGYHENSGLVHELRQSLAAHRAKGVV